MNLCNIISRFIQINRDRELLWSRCVETTDGRVYIRRVVFLSRIESIAFAQEVCRRRVVPQTSRIEDTACEAQPRKSVELHGTSTTSRGHLPSQAPFRTRYAALHVAFTFFSTHGSLRASPESGQLRSRIWIARKDVLRRTHDCRVAYNTRCCSNTRDNINIESYTYHVMVRRRTRRLSVTWDT